MFVVMSCFVDEMGRSITNVAGSVDTIEEASNIARTMAMHAADKNNTEVMEYNDTEHFCIKNTLVNCGILVDYGSLHFAVVKVGSISVFANLLEDATIYATDKHIKQVRKFNGEPYVEHPKRVSKIVCEFTHDANVIAAALLHDTLEDTDATYNEIKEKFNVEVADLVSELTSDKAKCNIMGKDKYLTKKMNGMSSDALLIKLADRLDNVSDLTITNEKWSKGYAEQTHYILTNLVNPQININHETLVERIKDKIRPFL